MPNKVLAKIAIETNYSLNWILTGQGEKFLAEEKKISIDEVFENRMREIFWQEFAKGAVNEKIQGVFFALQPNIRKYESHSDISLEDEILKTGT